jgi:hypothetical protein
MDNMLGMGVSSVVGLGLDFLLAKIPGKKDMNNEEIVAEINWWEIRETLTVTQTQILQYMKAKKDTPITTLQEKFSFTPDRELYYRLEQICLMDFIMQERREGEVFYKLNPTYSGTVEDDKTVMFSQG